MKAYDYTSQSWVTGAQAVRIRREQILQDIALLESDKGEEYVRFINGDSKSAMLQRARRQLEDLCNN